MNRHLARVGPAERQCTVAAPRDRGGFRSRAVVVDGLRMHVREHRAPGEPVWVLLHGLAVSHRYLMPAAMALRPASVHVPDLLGFGLSGKPREVYGADRHAETVAAWLHTEGLGAARVLGHSFGCQVAVELAVRHPALVSGLVLVGPTADPAARSATGQAGRWLLDTTREDPWQARVLAADLLDAGLRRVLGTLRRSVRHRIEERLPLVAAPVLFVRGVRDPIAPLPWVQRAAALTPGARVVEVPLAGHNAATTAGPAVAAHALAMFGAGTSG